MTPRKIAIKKMTNEEMHESLSDLIEEYTDQNYHSEARLIEALLALGEDNPELERPLLEWMMEYKWLDHG